jgi:DNA repair photolyase
VINPYRACEHGCYYCYGAHFWKRSRFLQKTLKEDYTDFPYPKYELLRKLKREIGRKKVLPVLFSSITDPYTLKEKECKLTRALIEMLAKNSYPIIIQTKSDLVVRDIDLFKKTPSVVSISINTLEEEKAKKMEPYAPTPEKRLKALEKLSEKEINTVLFLDPVIPFFNDEKEIKDLLKRASEVGIKQVTLSTLRLRKDMFNRLNQNFPELAKKLLQLYFGKPEFRGDIITFLKRKDMR